MSRRPRGPSDRQIYYFDADDLETANAPKLEGQGILSKIVIFVLALCCCGTISLIVLAVASVSMQIPSSTIANSIGVSIDQRPRPQHHHQHQRSVLQRIALLKRAAPPRKGVDLESVKLAFPQWLDERDEYKVQAVVPDVLLALSYLVDDID